MDIKEELYNQIETELDFCDSSETPFICSNLADAESRTALVRTIADTCMQGKIDISQAISEVERLYSLNDLD